MSSVIQDSLKSFSRIFQEIKGRSSSGHEQCWTFREVAMAGKFHFFCCGVGCVQTEACPGVPGLLQL